MSIAKSSVTSRSLSSLSSILLATLTATSVLAVTGCGLLKKGGDDAGADDAAAVAVADAEVAEAAAAVPAAGAVLVGVNQNDVARFPDETPLANVAAVLQRPSNVREIPAVGKVVAALAKGVTVTETAQRGTSFLVVFDDAKDGQKRMGWVGAEAFTAAPAADAGVAPPKCTTPDVALRGDVDFCGRVCAADTACPAGQACKGEAKIFQNGKPGEQVKVCTVFTAPAPGIATQVVPARPGLADAAAPPALPPQAGDTALAKATEPRCAPNATFSKDGQCHKNCVIPNAPGVCAGGNKCQSCQGKNVCGAPNFCK